MTDSVTCCPKFNEEPWDEKTHNWENKMFIKDSVPQFLHMPFPPMFARKVSNMWEKVKAAKADPEIKDFLLLATDPSPWKSELYMSTTKEVPDAENVKFTGEFLSKVFKGPYNAVPKWIKVMDKFVAGKNKKVKKYYVYYPYCPKCAEKYGGNVGVVFAEVE